ncbi:MAG: hypothetical protein II846_00560 [Acetobacter sp.]|nr:hypothetical protein [Acetobacter sp.]
MFTGSGGGATVNEANNTEIVRQVFDANACKNQKPFETAFAALKDIRDSVLPPTACTLFVITPIHTSPNPNDLTGKTSVSQSSINLRDLVMASKLEKVSVIALEFVSPPSTTSNFTVNMPSSINPSFLYRDLPLVNICDSSHFWCDSLLNQSVGGSTQPSIISSSNGQKDIEFIYTQDGGQSWFFFRDNSAEDLEPSA